MESQFVADGELSFRFSFRYFHGGRNSVSRICGARVLMVRGRASGSRFRGNDVWRDFFEILLLAIVNTIRVLPMRV
jgi:hypothetical protein